MGMAGNNGGGKAASQLAKQHQQTDRRNEPERDMAKAEPRASASPIFCIADSDSSKPFSAMPSS